MSSIRLEKSSCSAACNLSSTTFCEGCGKYYCNRHLIKHRNKLTKQMEKVSSYHDQVQKLLVDETKRFSTHPLMKKIDDWEQQAILKIQQTAKDVRQQLKHVFTKHTTEMNDTFRQLSQQLNKARTDNNYLESDIESWLDKLNELKKDFQTPKTINIREDEHKNAFIDQIKLSHICIDSFHQPVGDIQTDNTTYAIFHGPSNGDATIRGNRELTSGTHRFRFQIKKLGIPKWVFFGIISKNTTAQASLYKTPSVYGWAGHHQVWLNGNHHHQYDGFRCEIDVNHTIEVLIDCDREKIRLINETVSVVHEISISIDKCSFPWVLYVGLFGANDQVRLQLA